MSEHTLGPWKAMPDTDTRGTPGWRIDSEDVSLLAWLADGYAAGDMSDEIEANARLIASAPQLAEENAALRVQREANFTLMNDLVTGAGMIQAELEQANEALRGLLNEWLTNPTNGQPWIGHSPAEVRLIARTRAALDTTEKGDAPDPNPTA